MPELGEVEIARANLESWWVGRSVEEIVVLDPQVFSSGGHRFDDVMRSKALEAGRRGKYLFVVFEHGDVVVFHFRMTGKITRHEAPDPRFTRVAWRVGELWLCFQDARRLGHIDVFTKREFQDYAPISKMGPEPFGLTGDVLCQRVGSRGLKAALMDQSVIAGVGNIAVSEVFFQLGLAPAIRAEALSKTQWQALADALDAFFKGVIAEHQSDDMQYVNQGGDNPFEVYGKLGQPCPRCETPIERVKVAGRSTYFCPNCQAPQV
ncbi:MAG: DNA-formamidopyrimidine glycosylase family protein [bacterium]